MASHHPLTGGDHIPLLLLLTLTVRCIHAQPPPPDPDPPYLTNPSFNPSMAIVIVVLISAFFFLGFFSIYIRQCAGSSSPASIRAGGTARSRRQRGLDDDVISSFPTLIYSEVKEHKLAKGALECAVCLAEFEDDETLRLLPKCDHAFHPDCIDAWLSNHVTCPVCRSNLVPDPNEPPKEVVLPVEHIDEHVVSVDEEERHEEQQQQADLERIINMKRAKSRARPVNLPRSHSTGHSLVQPGENLDRFTLRLPENVRKEIVELHRARSLRFPVGEGSSRRGGSFGRTGRPIQLGRSDRWPSVLLRTLSMKVPAWGKRDPDGSIKGTDGSIKGGKGVRSPLDCLGGGLNGADVDKSETSTAALNRV